MSKNAQRHLALTRRDFLRGSSFASMMAMMGAVPLRSQPGDPSWAIRNFGPPINCGVIGCGVRGREILANLARIPNVTVLGVCDTYAPFLKRAKDAAPKAQGYADYKELLANKDIPAVLVATPTHQHKDIVLAALAAGKHVYCEAPLAHTIEDARTIARAARAAERCNFQVGLPYRANPQYLFLLPYMRSDTVGKYLMARAQWNKKTSWRGTSPNSQREKEINWRLDKNLSLGLIGEIGLHQIDVVNWYFNGLPVAVTGFGDILYWKDGPDREVPDTIQAVFQYPSGANLVYHSTIGNSFDGEYELFHGTLSSVLLRSDIGWQIKEEDAPMLGWEVYARKEKFYNQSGLVLQVNSSREEAIGPLEEILHPPKDELRFSLQAFISNTNTLVGGLADFEAAFSEKTAEAANYLGQLRKEKSWMPVAGYREGFESAVTVIKANEAIITKQRVIYPSGCFEL